MINSYLFIITKETIAFSIQVYLPKIWITYAAKHLVMADKQILRRDTRVTSYDNVCQDNTE